MHDQDIVRLVHKQTGRHLHAQARPAPVTKAAFEVSGYGNYTAGESDINDLWRIEFVHDTATSTSASGNEQGNEKVMRPVTTQFRIRHLILGCLLSQQNQLLPEWGQKQQEVVCEPDLGKHGRSATIWNVEHHWYKGLVETPLVLFPPTFLLGRAKSFLYDTLYLHAAIVRVHESFVAPKGEVKAPASTWLQWPFLHVGIRMTHWTEDKRKYFMVGNPAVWWSASSSVLAALLLWAWYIMMQGLRRIWKNVSRDRDDQDCPISAQSPMILCGLGWCLHYLPFGLASRVLYLHHYFPALYFGILLFPWLLDHVLLHRFAWKEWPAFQGLIYGGVALLVAWTFWQFQCLSYGFEGPALDRVSHLQWRQTWTLIDGPDTARVASSEGGNANVS